MPSLVENLPHTAPGVRAEIPARRAPLPLAEETPPRGRRSTRPRLAELAEQVRQVSARWQPPLRYCSTGWRELDVALGGGLPVAAIHELIAEEEGSPAYTVAWRIAARAAGLRRWIVYIDAGYDLYPPALRSLGVPLGRLIVVRGIGGGDALWTAEQVLRSSAVAALVWPLCRLDAYASRRLQLAAEAGGGLGLLIRSDMTGGPTFAATRLRCELVLGGGAARHIRLTVLKSRHGGPREPVFLEWPDAADFVPAHAGAADGAGAAGGSGSG